MLLFLIRGHSQRSPLPEAMPAGSEVRHYTTELLSAALLLCTWCVLRLLVSHDTSHGIDALLAVSGLAVGVATVRHCLRSPHL